MFFCEIAHSGDGVFEVHGRVGLWRLEKPFFIVFDHYPVTPGHVLVVPCRHVATLAQLNFGEWRSLQSFLQLAKKLITSWGLRQIYQGYIDNPLDERSLDFCTAAYHHPGITGKPDGYNWGVNEGEAAGQTVGHLHIHVIPRYFGDMEDPTSGVRHVIPEKGNYKK